MGISLSRKKSAKSATNRPTSKIRYYKNVVLPDGNSDTILFESQAEQEAWFDKHEYLDEQPTYYQRTEAQIRTKYPVETIWQYNYVRIDNPSVKGEAPGQLGINRFYGFIDHDTYINDGVTYVSWHIDYLQTYLFKYKVIGNYFVAQGHVKDLTFSNLPIGLNANCLPNFGHWAVTPETVGGNADPVIWSREQFSFVKNTNNDGYDAAGQNVIFIVNIVQPYDSQQGGGSDSMLLGSDVGLGTPLNYLIVAYDVNTGQSLKMVFNNVNDGNGNKITVNVNDNQNVMLGRLLYDMGATNAFNGNNGSSTLARYATQYFGASYTYDDGSKTVTIEWPDASQNFIIGEPFVKEYKFQTADGKADGGKDLFAAHIETMPTGAFDQSQELTNPWDSIIDQIDNQTMAGIKTRLAPKLMFYPYFSYYLNDGRGQFNQFKMQQFAQWGTIDSDGHVNMPRLQLSRVGSLSFSHQTLYAFREYQHKTALNSGVSDINMITQWGLRDTQSWDLPIVSDAYVSFLYTSKNQLNANKNSAAIAQTNANIDINNQKANQQVNNDLLAKQASIQNVANTAGAGVSAEATRDQYTGQYLQYRATAANKTIGQAGGGNSSVAGLAQRGMNQYGYGMAMQQDAAISATMQNAAISNQQTSDLANANIGAANLTLANDVSAKQAIAQNNYNAAMQQAMAGAKDLQHQESTASKGGDAYFDFLNNNYYMIGGWYGVLPEELPYIYRSFQMYGYMLNELHTGSFSNFIRSRTKVNFVKTVGIQVNGEFNHDVREALQGIFDSGVHFWHTDKLFDYSDNYQIDDPDRTPVTWDLDPRGNTFNGTFTEGE